MDKYNDTLIIIGLVAIAIYYNQVNLALPIATGLLGYLRGRNDEATKTIPTIT